MAITYRTTTYGGANLPLTNTQVDENFSWLDLNKTSTRFRGDTTGTLVSGDITLAAGTNIGITQVGNVITLNSTASGIPTQTGNSGKYLTTNGTTASWADVGGAVLLDDNTTNSSYYLTLSNATSGAYSTAIVSTNKLYFNPSTGTLNSTSFNSLSDERFKTDLQQITFALDKLNTLSGYTFTLVESSQKSAGLTAQQVSKVLPEAIGGDTDKMTVNYGAVMGLLVEAIKELNQKVDTLQNQINNK